ncbi:MAG TPA: hypothetical protein VHC63_13520 [Acidimicrobiales bacterium]|nr:hypothetical protein [Acidimicrobiales bacterium]
MTAAAVVIGFWVACSLSFGFGAWWASRGDSGAVEGLLSEADVRALVAAEVKRARRRDRNIEKVEGSHPTLDAAGRWQW